MKIRLRPLRIGGFSAILEDLGQWAGTGGGMAGRPFAAGRERQAALDQLQSILIGMAPQEPGGAPRPPTGLYDEILATASTVLLQQTEAETVAAELALHAGLTERELRRLRRRFARRYHPDLLPASLREEATRRMIIANGLIDLALRSRRDQARSAL